MFEKIPLIVGVNQSSDEEDMSLLRWTKAAKIVQYKALMASHFEGLFYLLIKL